MSPANIARELVHKTSSEGDSILIVISSNEVLYASKGQYGGWIIKKPINDLKDIKALWCYNREIRKIDDFSELERYPEVRAFIEKLKQYNIEMPSAEEVTYYYHPVKVEIKKTTDRYTVIDIVPEDAVITARAIRLKWVRHYSRKGNCSGLLCDEEDRQKLELIGKMLNVQVYTIPAPRRDFITIAKFVIDYVEVERYLSEKLEAEKTEEEEEVSEEVEEPVELPPLPEFKPRELTLEPSTPAVVPVPAEKPERSELVKIYLLSMRLPSKYLVQSVKIQTNENNARELRIWEGVRNEIARKLEGIRTEATKMAQRVFCHVEEYGVWIAITDEAVEEARRISKFVTDKLSELVPKLSQVKDVDLSRYFVKAVPVYLEPEDAKELLDVAVRKLSDDVATLAEKIKKAEEERNKRALRRLQQDYNYRRNLLETFKKFLESLPK
jgi:hypothetical protein